MKLQRTGITEAILLFDRWLFENNIPHLPHVEGEFIQWLYSSSGWYDKDIKGSYFDIDVEAVKNSPLYYAWRFLFKRSLLNSDYLEMMLWNKWIDAYFPNKYSEYRTFVESFNAKDNSLNDKSPNYNYWDNPEKMFPYLKGRVLLVNSMAPLLVSQYKNAHMVYKYMPEFEPIEQLFPYCFFNNGPDKNGLETLYRILEEIKTKDFDVALISAGPYGCLIADELNKTGKTTLTVGSGISKLFTISPGKPQPFWLSEIPKEFIPEGFDKIEHGRYWIGGE